MPDASSLRSLRCPNCGAPLDFAPGQSSVRCRFCDSVIEHSNDALTADDHARVISADATGGASSGVAAGQARRFIIKMRDGQPVVIESSNIPGAQPLMMGASAQAWQSGGTFGNVASVPLITPQPRRSSPLGCLFAVVIVIGVFAAVPAIILFTSPTAAAFVSQLLSGNVQQAIGTAGTIGARILVGRSGTIVPGLNDGPAEAIMLTTQYPASGSTNETRVVAVSTTTRKLLWQTAPLDQKLYDTPILANTNFVFIVNNQQLMAIRRTDGTLGWQATLADKISYSVCRDCMQLVGTRLAVLSDDGTLEAFDAATGKSQWKVRAKQDSPRGLYVLGQRLAFMDRNPDVKGVLRAFNVDTGKEINVQPVCKSADGEDYADWTTPLTISPKGTDFYLVFGFSRKCAQRWIVQSLKMVWSASVPEDFSASLDSLRPAFSADSLYLASDSNVLALAIEGGAARITLADPDYHFEVLAIHGGDVIVQAKRQRGTTHYEIWAVNGASGQVHWKFDLGENPPVEAGGIIDDNKPMWLAQPAADGLRVVSFKGAADNKSYALLTDTLGWDSGQSGGQKSTPLNIDTIILTAPDWTIWKNDTMWLVMENQLMAFDFAQRKIVYQWP
jgi:LSD1 subclass zinc finger protein